MTGREPRAVHPSSRWAPADSRASRLAVGPSAMPASPRSASTSLTPTGPSRIRWQRVALYAFLIFMAVTWLFPLLWAVFTAFRPYSDTLAR